MTNTMTASCRSCGATLNHTFVDLGKSPLANSYINPTQLDQSEPLYPLHLHVCDHCFLVQLEAVTRPEEIFSDYAYFSSYSDSWLEHARKYTNTIIEQFSLSFSSQVVEIASNDGYLLRYFLVRGMPVLGIEPAKNVAKVANERGIPTIVEFFGKKKASELADKGLKADLLVGNNVLAHVPDLHDFIAGMKILLKPTGLITMEFPHLMRLMAENQFDTIYHEHFSYFSLTTVRKLFFRHKLTVFDVEELPTHGGSLRVYLRHDQDESKPVGARVMDLLAREEAAGLTRIEFYLSFQKKVEETKQKFLDFLVHSKSQGKTVVGYGAPAKGNTLLNYCGVHRDFIDYTVDRSPHKQGLLLPGTHIPVCAPDRIAETRPDYVVILPWNLREEIINQMSYIRDWNGKFVVPIPQVQVL
jgi:SAM-dependent methyltransferase